MPSVVFLYCYAECLYAECHYAECRYAECCGAKHMHANIELGRKIKHFSLKHQILETILIQKTPFVNLISAS